jgi:hypothetical protein
MRFRSLWLVALFLVSASGALIYRMGTGYGCGPFFPTAFFTYSLHPDFPLDGYARGQLGVIQPTYAQSYLYVAYRYLSGRKFNSEEQKALLDLWHYRLAFELPDGQDSSHAVKKSWPQLWLEARKKVPGAGPDPSIEYFRSFGNNYQQFVNCTDESFKSAIATLDERLARFGVDNPTVKEWLGAQDQVFANCTGRGQGIRPVSEKQALVKFIPVALQSSASPVARADRDYQIAAAYFYATDYDEAGKRFQAIAQDSVSPWRQIARLLVVRCVLRKATLSTDDDKYDKGPLAQAASQLHQILDDRNMADVHASAQRLLEFIEFRIHPLEMERQLATHLLLDNIESTLRQNLWDYTTLADRSFRLDGEQTAKTAAGQPSQVVGATKDNLAGDDLTDWIATMQGTNAQSVDQIAGRWKQSRSMPWLVASISKIRAGQPGVPELLKASEGVAPNSPGFATVAFHRLRLMSEANNADEVRASLDKLLPENQKKMPLSAQNLFLALRMKVATTLDELLRFAQRVPTTVAYDTEGMELPDNIDSHSAGGKEVAAEPTRFDNDATEILNKMLPLEVLARAAEAKTLPDDLRRQMAQAAWVRAVILGDAAMAQRMTPVWESLEPPVKNLLEVYRAEKSPEAAQFAAIYLMLKFPGTRPIVDSGVARLTRVDAIDNYRDNWWCLPEPGAPKDPSDGDLGRMVLSRPLRSLYPGGEPGAPAFLSGEEKARGQEDWKKLRQLGVAPDFFAREVLA